MSYHAGAPEPELVYARKGEVAELHAKIKKLRGAISQIHDVCIDNGVAGCDTAMALKFVRSVALQALESTSPNRL